MARLTNDFDFEPNPYYGKDTHNKKIIIGIVSGLVVAIAIVLAAFIILTPRQLPEPDAPVVEIPEEGMGELVAEPVEEETTTAEEAVEEVEPSGNVVSQEVPPAASNVTVNVSNVEISEDGSEAYVTATFTNNGQETIDYISPKFIATYEEENNYGEVVPKQVQVGVYHFNKYYSGGYTSLGEPNTSSTTYDRCIFFLKPNETRETYMVVQSPNNGEEKLIGLELDTSTSCVVSEQGKDEYEYVRESIPILNAQDFIVSEPTLSTKVLNEYDSVSNVVCNIQNIGDKHYRFIEALFLQRNTDAQGAPYERYTVLRCEALAPNQTAEATDGTLFYLPDGSGFGGTYELVGLFGDVDTSM